MSKKTDWEAIESAYRVGSLSVRAVADAHGTKESTIRSRASKHGWQRDLTEKVKTATKTKLSNNPSRIGVAQRSLRDDAQIVDEASDEAASVVLAHRSNLSQWRGIAARLSDALSDMDITEDNHDKIARSLNSGVDALLKVIKGERQAYNLDDDEIERAGKSLADLLSEVTPGVE
jgi:hypothetical protein